MELYRDCTWDYIEIAHCHVQWGSIGIAHGMKALLQGCLKMNLILQMKNYAEGV